MIYLIESVVIDWTHQVDAFLKQDSSQAIQEGLNPGPMVEIDFWQTRSSNLADIHEQVNYYAQKNYILVIVVKILTRIFYVGRSNCLTFLSIKHLDLLFTPQKTNLELKQNGNYPRKVDF